MTSQLNQRLLADLAALLANYDPEEIRQALHALSRPGALPSLTELVERAIAAGMRRKSRRNVPRRHVPLSNDERLLRIKASRPNEAALIDTLLAASMIPWSRARVERLAELSRHYERRLITGKTTAQRRAQIIALVEDAPRRLLEEMLEEFRGGGHEGATLQDWSEIILKDRKPKA